MTQSMSHKAYISDPSFVPGLPRFSLRTLLIVLLATSIVLAIFAGLRDRHFKHMVKVAQQKKAILDTLDQCAKDAEFVRAKLGRAPEHVDELERLMGHPMPETQGRRVHYRRIDANSYELAYLVEWVEGFSGDWLVFDSNKPAAGWVPFYD